MGQALGLVKLIGNGSLRGALTPLVAAMRAEQALLGAERADAIFSAYSQALSLVPGLTGEYLRRAFYAQTLPSCGRDFTVGFGTVFSKQGVRIGDRVYIGMHCTLGHATIGDHVTIGSNVDILSGAGQHDFSDLTRPIQDQGGQYVTVAVGDNGWLGNGTTVMADIGAATIVGAGSVVTKPLPERVIAVGNPARIVRER